MADDGEGGTACEAVCNLVERDVSCRVSSVLDRNTRMYGKQHMFDGTEDSCWNSDQGVPQYVWIRFGRRVSIREVQVMFQGGFVGKTCEISAGSADLAPVTTIYPKDINSLQSFPVSCQEVTQIRFTFLESTDFFGRVTIYQLRVLGVFIDPPPEEEDDEESDAE